MSISVAKNLALFDLDNTLLSSDSDYLWGEFACENNIVNATEFRKKNNEYMQQYRQGVLDADEFVAFQLNVLTKFPRETLNNFYKEYFDNKIKPVILPKGIDLVQRHLQNGDLCALVSATNSFITAPIARYFKIPYLICTTAEQNMENGNYTGECIGKKSFREGKIFRVEQFLQNYGLFWGSFEKTYFYSDSFNDLPLLNKVSNPVAVNPDAKLLEAAQKNNWTILDLR